MKIGIFTFHCVANYGAVLQTYCLQEVLKNMGHEVYVIDYCPDYLLKPYKTFFFDSKCYSSFLSKIKGFVRACLVMPIRWKRNMAFSDFKSRHLNLYQLNLNDESNNFDAFVFGSDQIWNPKITNGFDKIYLGDFPAAKGKKLIAYAASAGSVLNFAGENADYFLSRLKCFDKVFVREQSLADYINNKLSISVKAVLDPVLLAGRAVLEKLNSHSYIGKRPFLLLFQLKRIDLIANYAIDIAKQRKFEFVELATMGESIFNRNMKQTLSVEKLLTYFKESSYVITSSFHGTVISIIYNRPFNTISVNKAVDERAYTLLEMLGISDRMIKLDEKSSFNDIIEYSNVEKLLNENRQANIEFLRSILL